MLDPRKHAVVEVIHKTAEGTDATATYLGTVTHSLKVISAVNAFRKYNPLIEKVYKNMARVPNMRGMLISARWGSIYKIDGPFDDAIGNIGFVAAFIANFTKYFDKAEDIWRLKNDKDRGAKLVMLASAVASKTLGGAAEGGVHALALALRGSCMLAPIVMANPQLLPASQKVAASIKAADARVSTTIHTVTEPDVMYWAMTVEVKRLVRWGMGL